MPVEKITAQQFSKAISDDILDRDSSLDVTFGPVRDTVIRPVGRILESQNDRVRKVFDLLSLLNLDQIDPADLDDFVYNEGLVRSPGTRSNTTVIFARSQAPSADIPIPINFPIASSTDPSTGAQISFVTSAAKTMFSAAPGQYYNINTSNYELEVPVVAVNTGADGNVGSGRISVALRGLTDFDSVKNRVAATGGTAEEINEQLAQRYLIRVMGTDISTPLGIKRFVTDFFTQALDAAVVYGSDSLMIREDTDAGAVDLWVLGESLSPATDTAYYPGVEQLITLSNQPVRGISMVQDSVPNTYVEGIDFEFVKDTGIRYGSVRGQDGIRFLTTGSVPLANAVLTITYTYNALFSSLQSFFQSPGYCDPGRDLLFREGVSVPIVLTGALTVQSGDPATVLNNVLTAVSTFVNTVTRSSGGLGDNVERFDLDVQIGRVQGVNNFTISQLSRYSSTGVGDISIGKNEYARISSANLNVTFV